MSDAIVTTGLTRDFDAVRALDNVSMAIPAGTIFGFLGPNGAGKTTMIRVLLGLIRPSSGAAEVLGYDIRREADQIREKTGVLLEHTGLYEGMTAEENLEFYGRIARIPGQERAARIQELLTHFGLWDRRKEPVGKWSRGMKQKVAIARAVLHRPPLVFLDEPTDGLDPIAAVEVNRDLVSLARQEGVTVFLTTHKLDEAERICHQLGVIRKGELLAVGSPQDLRLKGGNPRAEIIGSGFTPYSLDLLRARPEVDSVELSMDRIRMTLKGRVDISPLVSLVVHSGAAVEEVRRDKATLEDVYVSLMGNT